MVLAFSDFLLFVPLMTVVFQTWTSVSRPAVTTARRRVSTPWEVTTAPVGVGGAYCPTAKRALVSFTERPSLSSFLNSFFFSNSMFSRNSPFLPSVAGHVTSWCFMLRVNPTAHPISWPLHTFLVRTQDSITWFMYPVRHSLLMSNLSQSECKHYAYVLYQTLSLYRTLIMDQYVNYTTRIEQT